MGALDRRHIAGQRLRAARSRVGDWCWREYCALDGRELSSIRSASRRVLRRLRPGTLFKLRTLVGLLGRSRGSQGLSRSSGGGARHGLAAVNACAQKAFAGWAFGGSSRECAFLEPPKSPTARPQFPGMGTVTAKGGAIPADSGGESLPEKRPTWPTTSDDVNKGVVARLSSAGIVLTSFAAVFTVLGIGTFILQRDGRNRAYG